jgi:hypothetical protein
MVCSKIAIVAFSRFYNLIRIVYEVRGCQQLRFENARPLSLLFRVFRTRSR